MSLPVPVHTPYAQHGRRVHGTKSPGLVNIIKLTTSTLRWLLVKNLTSDQASKHLSKTTLHHSATVTNFITSPTYSGPDRRSAHMCQQSFPTERRRTFDVANRPANAPAGACIQGSSVTGTLGKASLAS